MIDGLGTGVSVSSVIPLLDPTAAFQEVKRGSLQKVLNAHRRLAQPAKLREEYAICFDRLVSRSRFPLVIYHSSLTHVENDMQFWIMSANTADLALAGT